MGYCDNKTNILDTSEFHAFALHCLGCISLPVYVFGTYCILFRTPMTMRSVQWTLFNFHIWSCSLDVGISFLTTPYVFFPALAGYPLGLLKNVGVGTAEQALLIVAMMGITFASILGIFESRLRILIFSNNFWHSVRVPWLLVNYLMGALFFVPSYLTVPEQKTAVVDLSKFAECIPSYTHIELVFVLSVRTALLLRSGACTLFPIAFQITVVTLLTGRIIRQRGKRMSEATASLQRTFQSALLAQVCLNSQNKSKRAVLSFSSPYSSYSSLSPTASGFCITTRQSTTFV
uniref:Uncharacterized protein n=1 Tax=Caenorhabditis japonica TaxID=281687 RepID=A0A8R1HJ10_CAEJA